MDNIVNNFRAIDFKLPPPKDLSEDGRITLINSSARRIWEGALELRGDLVPADSTQAGGSSAVELWMLLLVRLITRVAKPPIELEETEDDKQVADYYSRQDQLRQTLCNYIMSDFPSRLVLPSFYFCTVCSVSRIPESGWRRHG